MSRTPRTGELVQVSKTDRCEQRIDAIFLFGYPGRVQYPYICVISNDYNIEKYRKGSSYFHDQFRHIRPHHTPGQITLPPQESRAEFLSFDS